MLRTCRLPLFSILFPLVLFSSSCTKTILHQTTPYRAGDPTLTQPLPIAGLWSIKRVDSHGQLQTVASDKILPQGTMAGFETDQTTHTIYALAGDQRFALKTPPDTNGHLLWFSRQKVPSHLAREFDKALVAAKPVLATAAVGAAIAGTAYLESQTNCDDKNDDPNFRPHRRRRNH